MANLITLSRILLVAPFIACFFIDAAWGQKAAFFIFSIAALTDFIDGRVARARGETSALGAALDPLADKLLIAAALILLIMIGTIHLVHVTAGLIIILREILVGGLREALAKRGAGLPVTTLAKWKTTAQIIAVGLLIAAAPTGLVGRSAEPAGILLLWLAALLTFITGWDYVRRAVGLLGAARP
ncbi:MAG: CDP-diacylglycerol--glycerol-3-phosphate 3-phosphatidyltransferase [Parvularculaceae bacterium]